MFLAIYDLEILRQFAWKYAPHILVSSTTLYFLYVRYHNELRKVPGPFFESCSVLPRLWSTIGGHPEARELELHAKYGNIVRLGPNLVSLSDPAEIQHVYGVTSKFYKSPFFTPFEVHDAEGLLPDPLVLKDKAVHTRMKRNGASAYSMAGAVQAETFMDAITERLIRILDEKHVNTGAVCDMGNYMHLYATDVIFNVTFGTDMNFLEGGDYIHMLKTMTIFFNYSGIVGQIPWIHKFLLGNSFVPQLIFGDNRLDARLLTVAEEQVAKYKEQMSDAATTNDTGAVTFLHRLLQTQAAKPDTLTDRETLTHSFGNITAGGDTTSIAMKTTLYHVLQNPGIHTKLVHELRSSATPLSHPIKFETASALPYLNAVIREALRIHPPTAFIFPRTVPAPGATISGYFLPAGTEVGHNPWILHRDPALFPDGDKFIPERWIDADADRLVAMNRAFFAFSAGPHTCSGRHISLVEVTKIVATLFVLYDMELADPAKEWTFTNRWFAPQSGLDIRLRARKSEEKDNRRGIKD